MLFAGEGAKLAVIDCDAAAAARTLQNIAAIGGEAACFVGDVTDEKACGQMTRAAADRFGGLDVLVNNVGRGDGLARLDGLESNAWQAAFDINLKSALLMSLAALPFLAAGKRGAIVNIASIAGLRSYGTLGYGPAKAALLALTREIALAHGLQGIRANAVAPGHVRTPAIEDTLDGPDLAARAAVGPLGIEGDAWDVAAASLFLASDEARFITGACLPVDGGVTCIGSLAAIGLLRAREQDS
jgi:NAD(P)-dependent dehydrogenase (short-subunit alcohol dehydrogenase family)